MAGRVSTRPATPAKTAEAAAAIDVAAAHWEDAVRAAARLLVDSGAAEPRYAERCVEIVRDQGPYIVVAPGIALAHARPEDGALRVGVAVAVLARPVVFGHPANDPVDVVFAICSHDKNAHLQLLSRLAARLVDGLADDMRAARTPAQAAAILNEVTVERGDVMTDFGDTIRAHLLEVERHNEAALDKVSELLLDVVEGDHLIYVTGTGHSIALMLETFYRAGGLACVQPLYHPSLLPLHGGQASTLCEHAPGLAKLMVENYTAGPGDIAFVFSNSGVNAVPVELADELRARGTTVVAVVSLTHLRAAPARVDHKIDESADIILDTLVPYGDAAYPTGDGGVAIAGLSSITGVYLWDLLLARLADLAGARGVRLPVWTSSNVAGGAERNAELFARFGKRVQLL